MTSSHGNIFRVIGPLCGNSPFTGEFPTKWPVARGIDVFFDLRMNKRLSKQSWGWWFEAPSRPLWRHCNVIMEPIYHEDIMHHNVIPEQNITVFTNCSKYYKLKELLIKSVFGVWMYGWEYNILPLIQIMTGNTLLSKQVTTKLSHDNIYDVTGSEWVKCGDALHKEYFINTNHLE